MCNLIFYYLILFLLLNFLRWHSGNNFYFFLLCLKHPCQTMSAAFSEWTVYTPQWPMDRFCFILGNILIADTNDKLHWDHLQRPPPPWQIVSWFIPAQSVCEFPTCRGMKSSIITHYLLVASMWEKANFQ